MTNSTLKGNGQMPRKTLATQLDRLDEILDGLADNLDAAVAGAVKDAVGLAIKEAVQGVLTEVLTNPELLAKLRPDPAPQVVAATPAVPTPATKRPGWLSRLAGAAKEACGKAANLARQGRRQVGQLTRGAWENRSAWLTKASARVRVLAQGFWALLRGAAGVAYQLRKPLLIALGVGVVLGLGCYLAGPVVSSAVSGFAGFVGSLAASAVNSLRRALPGRDFPDA